MRPSQADSSDLLGYESLGYGARPATDTFVVMGLKSKKRRSDDLTVWK
jgi:hypothetical protein